MNDNQSAHRIRPGDVPDAPFPLTVIVPAYNEAATIATLLDHVSAAPYSKQVIVVDDGSSDGTAAVVAKWRADYQGSASVEVVSHPSNRGKGAAVRTALSAARGQVTLIQDADLEYDPADYPELIEPILACRADVVFGYRPRRRGRGLNGLISRWFVELLNLLVRILYGQRITDEASGYKAFRTTVLRSMNLACERFEFCPEVTAKACRMGIPIQEVPIGYRPRTFVEGKKIGWRDGIKAVITLMYWRLARFRQVEPSLPFTGDAPDAGNDPHRGDADRPAGPQRYVPGALLILHLALLGWSATQHSPTIDEAAHLPAGLSHWLLGRYHLYAVNPPLVRSVAALPVLLCDPEVDWSRFNPAPSTRPEFDVGFDFIRANGRRAMWLYTVGRWGCIPFSLLAGWICHLWARAVFGWQSGCLALSLWCLSPMILGHGSLLTPDVGAAAMGVTACYCFRAWLRQPTWFSAALSGIALGCAMAAKFTLLILLVLWPTLWLLRPNRTIRQCLHRGAAAEIAQLAFGAAIAIFVVNIWYGFEDSFRPLGEYTFVSRSLSGDSGSNNRFRQTFLARLPVPTPRNYLRGIDLQKRDFERAFRSYLLGTWKESGWWYYYLVALAVKVPLGAWGLVVITAVYRLARWAKGVACPEEIQLLAPPLLFLMLVSSQTGFSHHLRYVLPMFPFMMIWASQVIIVARGNRLLRGCVVSAWMWFAGSSLWYYPHSLSYFNELAGGPLGGHRVLVDSNLDWGQDLLFLKGWLDSHSEAQPLGLAYFGPTDPRILGIEYRLPPLGPITEEQRLSRRSQWVGPLPGWFAVSVSTLKGLHYGLRDGDGEWQYVPELSFTYFEEFKPIARAGYSIYIYHLNFDEVNLVRMKMGLKPLDHSARLD